MLEFIPLEIRSNTEADTQKAPPFWLPFPYFDSSRWRVEGPYLPPSFTISPGRVAFTSPYSVGHFFDPSRWKYIMNISPYSIFLRVDGIDTLLAPWEKIYVQGSVVELTRWIGENGSLTLGSWDEVIFLSED